MTAFAPCSRAPAAARKDRAGAPPHAEQHAGSTEGLHVSSTAARHRKPPRPPARQQQLAALAARARHRKPSALQGKPAKATAVTALAVSAAASAAVTQWPAGHPHSDSSAAIAATAPP